MKLFLQNKCKHFERLGLRPQTPVPPAAGGLAPKPPGFSGWGLRPQTPIGLRRLGAPPPDPQNSPLLRISGYAPEDTAVQNVICSKSETFFLIRINVNNFNPFQV